MKSNDTIKVGIDARTLSIHGGSRTYAQNLINKLEESEEIEVVLYGKDDNGIISIRDSILRVFWENVYLPVKCIRDDIDILHGVKDVIPYISQIPKVVTYHDVTGVKLGDLYNTKQRAYNYVFKRQYVNQADRIIAVSKSTKKDLENQLGVKSEQITVIYEGVNQELFNQSYDGDMLKEYLQSSEIEIQSDQRVILSVGTISPRKNYTTLIDSFESIKTNSNEHTKLLIAGREGWKTNSIIEKTKKSEYRDDIHLLGFVPEYVLPHLYKRADVFVYPSLYEGFGLPPLEAMACGTPVITSNVSSLPEVVGDAGIKIDPNDTDQLTEEIQRVLENDTLHEQMQKKGLDRAHKFTWEKAANETIQLYKSILNSE
ncbi:glycosyltransferase family 4 protein [Haloarcula halophila]|uniref:glycosyltransferase family 4 protein n=1 Tax=Haloarcula TaxID=2237 RepID=UPI0023E4177C|nr:glycosyltransferase family 1 protein [Halomicroarcula sp. DFY41]